MNRMFGLTLVAGVVLGLNSTTQAQNFPTDYYGQGSYGSGHEGYGYEDAPFGGFGFEYTQGPPASGILMNRYGQVVGTSVVATSPIVTADPAAAVQPTVRQATRSRTRKAPIQPRYTVTTGSLAWPDMNGVVGYSPAMRQRSYGSGYALSPFGTTQYYGPWKGYTLGY